MRTVTQKKLDDIMAKHQLWLEDDPAGERADLSDTDLCHVDLRGAELQRANLRGAELCGADLLIVQLCSADLSNANLTGCNLDRANLYNTNLAGANLAGANLSGAVLFDANLANTKFDTNIIDAGSINHATFSEDALEWLICRDDWGWAKDTVNIEDSSNTQV